MKKLYFARHGESQANKDGLFAGTWDSPLTDRGRDEAKLEGQQAKALELDLMVCSTLSRAAETAEIIAVAIGYPKDRIVKSELLIERDYGNLQQKPYSQADGIDFEQVEGIETVRQLLDRGSRAADFLRNRSEEDILVVGHGTFGRVLRDRILKQTNEIEVPIEDELPNAKIIRWL